MVKHIFIRNWRQCTVFCLCQNVCVWILREVKMLLYKASSVCMLHVCTPEANIQLIMMN